MPAVLKYGLDSTVTLDLPPDVLLARCDVPRGELPSDPVAAVAAALLDPLEFPALSDATVPGDRVVLALQADVPQAPAVVAGVVHTLLDGSAEPGDITILVDRAPHVSDKENFTSQLSPDVRAAIELVAHDPTDRERLMYIAASKEAKPIYVNRTIGDADLVVPIGCVRSETSPGYVGIHGTLFPSFADKETQERFSAPISITSEVHRGRRRQEAKEAVRLLGVPLTVQVIPGSNERILHVLAGAADAVSARAEQLYDAAWNCDVPDRASLVVAAIEGGASQQTWDNLARALAAALRAVSDDGAVALCTDLDSAPGPALQRLAGADTLEEADRQIHAERTPDGLPAAQLVRALDRAKVYLISRLDEDVVESLGIAYVQCSEEIARLSTHHPSCILLANAQYAVPVPP